MTIAPKELEAPKKDLTTHGCEQVKYPTKDSSMNPKKASCTIKNGILEAMKRNENKHLVLDGLKGDEVQELNGLKKKRGGEFVFE